MQHEPRVMFVDDDPLFLEGVKHSLHGYHDVWEMVFVGSAQRALEEVGSQDFDAIITDVMMPGKDGFEFLAELRQNPKTRDLPVVIVTGTGDRGLKRRALEMGAADLLAKPIDREDLIARIRSVLQLKAYQDEIKAHSEELEARVTERTGQLDASRREIIWRLAKAGEYRDDVTGYHIARVGCYCRVIAEKLGMGSGFVEHLFLTSPLHDIGKIGIPDEILLKPGGFTPEERKVMEQHCAIGSCILMEVPKGMRAFQQWSEADSFGEGRIAGDPILRMASSIAMTHHERWDGRGYPLGLSGEAIPPESRIVGLADVYDALCSERPYKRAYSESEAVDIMEGEVGQHFDPAVFAAFEAVKSEFGAIRSELMDAKADIAA
jgi:putative two-component system response regulator